MSLVRDLAWSPFFVALSKSHLDTGSRGRTTDLEILCDEAGGSVA